LDLRALIPGQRTRALTALVSCALLLSLAIVMPAAAAGPLRLSGGQVSPDAGTAGDAFTFSLVYLSRDDAAPTHVRVILDGVQHDLAPVDPADDVWRNGARFSGRITIKAAGTHEFSFAADDDKGRHATLRGGTLTVKPKPTPKPTPKPPKAAPKPKPAPTATQRPNRPRPTERPRPATTAVDPTANPTDGPTPGVAIGVITGIDGGDGPGGPDTGLTGGPLDILSLPVATGSVHGNRDRIRRVQPGGASLVGIAAMMARLPGFGSEEWVVVAARGALVSTASASVVAMALFTFKRRRREDEDPYERPTTDDAVAAEPPPLREAPLTGEAAMPRWRRPSLHEARRAAPGASLAVIEAERLTFAGSAMAAETTHERRRIRYRMVRLADSPDEILGQEIGRLDEGDEVELLQRSGLYWQVRTPLGEVGWVHKMTLGDAIVAVAPVEADDADDDVLAAFEDAQARRAYQPYAEPVLGEGLAARFIRERGAN
jgi:hypothetical protein